MSKQRNSTSSPPQWTYDVFLSFRGEDTRKTFTDHLYTALEHRGIKTFRDEPELQKGKAISSGLFSAIEESRFALIILSQNYASSTWCLDELVKIIECMKARETVLPIFYNVDPSYVRKQTGSFGEALTEHEKRFGDDREKLQRWRTALTQVASFSGWNSKEGNEAKLIKDIVEVIWKKLKPALFNSVENLFGIDSSLQQINLLLDARVNDVRFIGIWGMGGIGKTTLVRVVYERISHEFEFSVFLNGVRNSVEKSGLLNLQKQLLSGIWTKSDDLLDLHEGASMIRRFFGCKKVLLILDDVSHPSQLKYLASHERCFGLGSRVLITTRNERLLIQHRVKNRLKAKALNYDDSLQLFSWKAFESGYPEKDFLDLSKSFVNYAKGLPLALEVLGSFLHGRSLSGWNNALQKLRKVCNQEIFDILKLSYEELDYEEKKIFLDIACFFNGEDKDRVTEVLTSCDVYAIIGIDVLMERSLLTLSHGRLWMHDLLRDMGREIVRRESLDEPNKRSRLWLPEDINNILSKNTGTEAIEGIFMDSTDESGVEVDVDAKSFSMMRKLRYLKINYGNLPNGLECLPNSLRILNWTGYPSKSLPQHFNPKKLLELSLCHSWINHFHPEMEALYNLKIINLNHSVNLLSTPNFRVMPYLELLSLEGCTRLDKVDPSIEMLSRLTMLNLKDCKKLVYFAGSLRGLKSLKIVNLSGCSKFNKLPNDMGHLECLEELYVNGTGIRELPSSIGMLKKLDLMSLEDCKHLVSLPSSVYGLKSLKMLNVSGCSKLDKLPEELGCIQCLVEVYADRTSIRELPSSIGMLERLVLMSLTNCKQLASLPRSVKGLKSLKMLNLSGCLKLDKLPGELGHVDCLEKLDVSGTSIRELPFLKNLEELSIRGYKGQSPKPWNPFLLFLKRSYVPARLSLPSLFGLPSLTTLDLSDCNLHEVAIPRDVGCLSSLRELNLSRNQFVGLPKSIYQFSKLRLLILDGCRNLQTLSKLPYDVMLNVSNCSSLETLSNPVEQCNLTLSTAKCVNCFKMVENESCTSIALSLLTCYLQDPPPERIHTGHRDPNRFNFVAPGNEIPEWYNHQSEGSSIIVQLHPDWLSNKWMGFALCVVFRLLKPLPPSLVGIGIRCSLSGKEYGPTLRLGGWWGPQPVPGHDHMWLFYAHRRHRYFLYSLQDCCNQLDFSFIPWAVNLNSAIDDGIVEVKKCGVRMIYMKDVEELGKKLLKQRGVNTERGLQHYDDTASESQEDGDEPHPKRFKLDLDGVGPSGSACIDDHELDG